MRTLARSAVMVLAVLFTAAPAEAAKEKQILRSTATYRAFGYRGGPARQAGTVYKGSTAKPAKKSTLRELLWPTGRGTATPAEGVKVAPPKTHRGQRGRGGKPRPAPAAEPSLVSN